MAKRTSTPTPAPVLEVRSLCVQYGGSRREPGVRALDDVSLQVQRGQRFGIVGESGSGKSTLARVMIGLTRPVSGQLLIDGTVLDFTSSSAVRAVQSRIQMVFQDPMSSLDPRMRIGDIVLEPLRGLGLPGADAARAAELLELVGLEPDAASRYPHQFSGGQRQRIAIARALAPDPEVIIADEAVSALDVSVRAQVLNVLLELTAARGLTLVLISHDLSVIRHMTEHVVVMRSGQVVESGPTEQVYTSPQEDYTQQLLAATPRLAYAPKVVRKRAPATRKVTKR